MDISTAVHLAWQLGAQESIAARKAEIGPVQFFCGMTKLADMARAQTLAANGVEPVDVAPVTREAAEAFGSFGRAGIDLTAMRRQLRARAGGGSHAYVAGEVVHRSDPLRDMFLRARTIADEDRGPQVELRHLVRAMLENRNLMVSRLVIDAGVALDLLIPATRGGHEPAPGEASPPGQAFPVGQASQAGQAFPAARNGRPTPVLDAYGRDLTALAIAGKLGPVIGRRDELLQLIRTLARRSKNNPVLVGEPGVGKTAVAELLAIRLAEGKHRDTLGNWRVVELSMAALLAGAKLLGEREARLEALIDECRDNEEVLLFIDELHTLVTAGGQSGAIDPKDIFKPALARGEIRCIGATTLAEYQKFIESDAALERRFDKILVVEPSAEETLDILQGLAPKMQEHHGIRVTEDALRCAIELSMTYDAGHQLPDKAIDLIDKAATFVRIPALSMLADAAGVPDEQSAITPDAVARALASKLGIPAESLTQARAGSALTSSLTALEVNLNERVLGQAEAARIIAERMVVVHAGLTRREGPRAVFLFLGTTGIGKTEMARSLAACLFGSARSLIRLDMSEYMEEHDVAKLIGAPPGYIGHDEPGQLTGPLRSTPYAVVLLDEIDKAHPRTLDLLLQVFDAGRLTDAKGRTIDARHAIFVMTANSLSDPVPHRVGFLRSSAEAAGQGSPEQRDLTSRFRPEFVNRIDAMINFRPLDAGVVRSLAERHLDEVTERMQARYAKTLTIREDVIDHLVAEGFSREYGARELRRTIERLVDSPLSELVLSARTADWPGFHVRLDGDRILIEPA